jgi:hypothetical protein
MASGTSRSDLRRAVVLLVGCALLAAGCTAEAATAAVPTLAGALRSRRRAGAPCSFISWCSGRGSRWGTKIPAIGTRIQNRWPQP